MSPVMSQGLPRVQIKVNASGSWANLVVCNGGQYRDVKAACEILAKAATSPLAFKSIDTASGDEIESFRDGVWKPRQAKASAASLPSCGGGR